MSTKQSQCFICSGAHFLQTVVKKFDDLSNVNQEMEDKTLDNVVLVLAQLYNFKVLILSAVLGF